MELQGKTIFILGIAKFDGQFESTSYTTAKYLAENNTVYYVDYPYTWKDYFGEKNTSFLKRAPYFSNKSDGLLDVGIKNLNILIIPPVLSINFLPEGIVYRLLNKINEGIIAKRIRKVIKTNKIAEFLFINSFNFHYPNVGPLIRPNLSIYHCVDPLIVAYDQKHGIISEKKIVEQSDMVICTSKELYRQKSILNKQTYFIPNAADLSLSSQALAADLKVNSRLDLIKKPIIGYFGNIERRIDFQLITDVINTNKDKSFVFAGPVVEEYIPVDFKKISNVYFIGQIPYAEMPSVIKGFDIAMIPFKKDEVSSTIFPLKLFEYLGAGKPVVSTYFNLDLADFTQDEVPYCADAKQFTVALNIKLHDTDKESIQKRVHIASENTWTRRLSELSTLINGYYFKKDG